MRLAALDHANLELRAQIGHYRQDAAQHKQQAEQFARERDEYKALYLALLERCRKLELGLLQKRERFSTNPSQLSLDVIATLLAASEPAADPALAPPPATPPAPPPPRAKPTGRKPLPEHLPRVDIELLPPEVEQQGLQSFVRIGEDITETVEHRAASMVVVRVHKPKFILKEAQGMRGCEILQAPPPDLPIERGLAGPGLLADTVVRRWQDQLPLHRLERIYGRSGLELARSTVCGWHGELATLAAPLIEAMWVDARTAPYLCMDATGVLVRALEKCRNAHFFVVVAPGKHVMFGYTPKHNGDAVDSLLADYKGYLVCDAHAVYEHLYKNGDVIECACWAHARRYWYKALQSDPDRAQHALALIQELFKIERQWATAPPADRLKARQTLSRKITDAFFTWVDKQADSVLDETPSAKAVGYALNQKQALLRYLDNAALPMHNNVSERELRRLALGRKAWLFLGSDDAGDVNATFTSLLASCQMHEIEPLGYLRDLFCLLPGWSVQRVLELAPANWKQTLQHADTQKLLAANVFRSASLGLLDSHSSAD